MKTVNLTDDRIDSALRRLDPASEVLTAAEQHHADDLKARILISAPDANILGRPPVPGDELPNPKPRRRRRLVLAGGAVVAVTAGLLAAPLFGDEERRPSAWSAVPTALPGDDARELGEKCMASAERTLGQPPPPPAGAEAPPEGSFAAEQRRAMRLVLGERRGPYDLVVLGNATGYELTCTFVDAGTDTGADRPSIAGGAYPLRTPARSSVSVSGTAMTIAAEPDAQVREGEPTRDESVAVAHGRLGADVRAVELSTPAGDVTATVTDGWFAATWPDWAGRSQDPFADVTVTLTLADGSRTAPVPYGSLPGRDIPPELLDRAGS